MNKVEQKYNTCSSNTQVLIDFGESDIRNNMTRLVYKLKIVAFMFYMFC